MISDLFKHKQHDYKFAHSMFVHFKKLKARESLQLEVEVKLWQHSHRVFFTLVEHLGQIFANFGIATEFNIIVFNRETSSRW